MGYEYRIISSGYCDETKKIYKNVKIESSNKLVEFMAMISKVNDIGSPNVLYAGKYNHMYGT
jgi:hypothetical protein